MKDLVALARSRPGQINYATPGTGTANHLVMEMFAAVTATRFTHVPYKGTAQALVALIGGDIELLVGQIASTRARIASGRVRPIALTGVRRSAALPQVPTFTESGVAGLEVMSWFGVALPAGAAREVVARLHGEIARALSSPDIRQRYLTEGADPESITLGDYAAFLRAEVGRWGKAVRDSGATAEH